MQINELALAQDTMNNAIKEAVETFLAEPSVNFQHGNVQAHRDVTGVVVVNVTTSVDAVIDNARITRTAPQA